MPIQQKTDTEGSYYQWGHHGKKYYYIKGNSHSRQIAKAKATRQAQAVYSTGWKEK